MKKLAFVLIAGLSFAAADAQSVQFGVKGGLNLATQSGWDAGDARTMANFNAGAYLQLGIGHGVYFQPEVLYSGQGTQYYVNGNTQHEHANYINVPLLLKFMHYSGFYVETGPQVGFLTSA